MCSRIVSSSVIEMYGMMIENSCCILLVLFRFVVFSILFGIDCSVVRIMIVKKVMLY